MPGEGKAMAETIERLFKLEDGALFSRAAEIAAAKERAYWSPVVLCGACRTDPPCRHCK